MEASQYRWAISASAQSISELIQSLQILSSASVEIVIYDGVEAD